MLLSGSEASALADNHWDEPLAQLIEEFGADHCRVLAYEHRDKPIWGVQFHPEYEQEYGSVVLDYVMGRSDKADVTYLDEHWDEDGLRVNACVFANFLKV